MRRLITDRRAYEKECPGCGKTKNASLFCLDKRAATGLKSYCRECTSARYSAWAQSNPEKLKSEQRLEQSRRANERHRENNPDKVRESARRWIEKNREKVRARGRKSSLALRANPFYRVSKSISSRIRKTLNGEKNYRSTFEMLGYTACALRAHLEAKFAVGMSWDNYGESWQIDHIRPCASFDQRENSIKDCWAMSNLRPLLKSENASKNSFWNGVLWRKGRPMAKIEGVAT